MGMEIIVLRQAAADHAARVPAGVGMGVNGEIGLKHLAGGSDRCPFLLAADQYLPEAFRGSRCSSRPQKGVEASASASSPDPDRVSTKAQSKAAMRRKEFVQSMIQPPLS